MRLAVLMTALAVAAPIGLWAGSSSARVFEDQSVLFGRRHGYVHEGPWCAREDIGGGSCPGALRVQLVRGVQPAGASGQSRLLHSDILRSASFDQRPTRARKQHRIR